MKTIYIILILVILGIAKPIQCCTVGVVSGNVTQDGRPLIWKTRDSSDGPNVVRYVDNSSDPGLYSYVAVLPEGSSTPRMGVNEEGFSIVNNDSGNLLPEGHEGMICKNAQFLKEALETCDRLSDFTYLVQTWTPPENCYISANYAVLDKFRNVAMIEMGNDDYEVFYVNLPAQAPDGWMVLSPGSRRRGIVLGGRRPAGPTPRPREGPVPARGSIGPIPPPRVEPEPGPPSPGWS